MFFLPTGGGRPSEAPCMPASWRPSAAYIKMRLSHGKRHVTAGNLCHFVAAFSGFYRSILYVRIAHAHKSVHLRAIKLPTVNFSARRAKRCGPMTSGCGATKGNAGGAASYGQTERDSPAVRRVVVAAAQVAKPPSVAGSPGLGAVRAAVPPRHHAPSIRDPTAPPRGRCHPREASSRRGDRRAVPVPRSGSRYRRADWLGCAPAQLCPACPHGLSASRARAVTHQGDSILPPPPQQPRQPRYTRRLDDG